MTQLYWDTRMTVDWLVENDNMTQEDAVEWIDYNVLRTIPYMGEKAPVVVYALY